MANEANVAKGELEELRVKWMQQQYDALKTDQERFKWLLDMNLIYYYTKETEGYLSTGQIDLLKQLEHNFYNPRDVEGYPEQEVFKERVEMLNRAMLDNRMEIAKGTDDLMSHGKNYKGLLEQSYFASQAGPNGLIKTVLDAQYKVIKTADKDFRKSFVNSLKGFDKSGMSQDVAYEKAVDHYFDQIITKTRKNSMGSPLLDRYNTITEQVKEKSASNYRDAVRDGQEKRDLEIAHVLVDTAIMENPELENKRIGDALDQFNTKRSAFFLGRESREHADLKTAAEKYQKSLQEYFNSQKLSILDKHNALVRLQKDADEMARLAGEYETKKGKPSTEAGRDRLEGALRLKNIGQEMSKRLIQENMWVDRLFKEEIKRLNQQDRDKKEKREREQKNKQDLIDKENQEWKKGEALAVDKGKYSELSAEMETARKFQGSLKTGSATDKQMRSAIGALDLKENQELFGPTNYDNPAISQVNNTEEAVAQIIAIQSLYAKDKDLHARGVDQTRLNWEMKRIQEMPGFNQMMENYAKEPGSLTRLARNNPAQLWQELLRTEQKILTGQDPKMEPRKPEGKDSYPYQESMAIKKMGEEKKTGTRIETNVENLDKKSRKKGEKEPEKSSSKNKKTTTKNKTKTNNKTVNQSMQDDWVMVDDQ